MRIVAWLGLGLLAACDGTEGDGGSPTDCEGGASRTEDILCLEPDTVNGADVYVARCQVCHGTDASGLTGLGSDIRGKAASETVDTIMDPPAGMTESLQDIMTNQEIADVAGYLETL